MEIHIHHYLALCSFQQDQSNRQLLFDNIHIDEIMQIIELSNLIKEDQKSEKLCFIITKQYDYDPQKFFYAYNYFEVDSLNFNKIPKNADFIIVNNSDDLIYSHFDAAFVGGTLMPGNIGDTDYNIPAMIHYNCIPIIGKFYQADQEFVELLDYKGIIIKKFDIYQLHLFYNEYLKSKNVVLDNKTNCMKMNKLKQESVLAIANEINTDAK